MACQEIKLRRYDQVRLPKETVITIWNRWRLQQAREQPQT